MNNIAVIYKSKYGTTSKYAQWIAQELDALLLEASKVTPAQLLSYDTVIYGGGLYAGGISGAGLVSKNPCKSLVVFTVGLSDPQTTDYTAILNKNFTAGLLSKIKVFHLRGGIDYKQLGLVDKGLMAMMRKMVASGKNQMSKLEDQLFLETYGGNVDFTNKDTIAPIVNFIKGKGLP